MQPFKPRHPNEQTTKSLQWVAGPNQRVAFIGLLTNLGVPRVEAFTVATGKKNLSMTEAEANRFIKAAQESGIPLTSYKVTP